MKLSLFNPSDTQSVIRLFTQVFTTSEGESEGEVIGTLVTNLIATTKPQELIGFTASDDDGIVACIFFSRFIVPNKQSAFILAPVAVATQHQGLGTGQKLIRYGLDYLKRQMVDLVFTYGDPAFYTKTGFKPIAETVVKAPFALSEPIGWLAQSLDGYPIETMQGATQCVEALSDSKYW